MAAGRLPEPGTEHGPCAEICKHLDCAESKRQAESACRICEKPIGYERGFYQENNWTVFVHSSCAHTEAEKGR